MSLARFERIANALRNSPVLLLSVAAFLSFAMWFYADRAWAPPAEMHFSDLYPRWYGSRELLIHRRDPYSLAVTRDIQIGMHGHAREIPPQREDYAQKPQEEDRFAYPVYVAFVLAPTIGFPFATVERIFRIILPLVAAATALLWMRALHWQVSRPARTALVLLTLGSFPVLECIYLQQPALLAGLFLAGSAAALTRGYLSAAGVLLALATIKPQLVALFVLWLLVWAISDLRRRMPFLLGFVIAMAVLLGSSELLLPGWLREFLQGLISYQHYTGNESILSLWLTHRGALIVTVALLMALAFAGWKFRSASADSARFMFASCLVLTTTLVVIPTMYPTGQILLVPAVFWLLQNGSEIFGSRAQKLSSFGALSIIVWPWIGALVFMLLSIFISRNSMRAHWLIPVSTLLITPMMVLIALAIRAPDVLKVEGAKLAMGTQEAVALGREL